MERIRSFEEKMASCGLSSQRGSLHTLQINLGKYCNLACRHCHVGAGPNKKKENMGEKTAKKLIRLIQEMPDLKCVDLTGGAPELNPWFRDVIESVSRPGLEIIDRCNLTVFYEPGQGDTPQFLKKYHVTVVASLPCYQPENVNLQRGDGVFVQSIEALKTLNSLGYGRSDPELQLHLVYNPIGAVLPPEQKTLESDYKVRLKQAFGIEFDRLFCITNMPIKRFLVDLKKQKKLNAYYDLLQSNFNADAGKQIMCRSLISVDWKGDLFDCDFNQALNLPLRSTPANIIDINSLSELENTNIEFANHCYGCTAGAGSSCTGEVAS